MQVTKRFVYSMESYNCLMKEQENKSMYDHRASGSTNSRRLTGKQQLQGSLSYVVNKLLVLSIIMEVKWVQTYSGT
jgi:hypothetical protein